MRKNDSGWREILESDLRSMGLDTGWRWRFVLTNRVAWFVRRLRIAESGRSRAGLIPKIQYLVNRIWLDRIGERLGFDIPLGVFGPGLSIAHRGTIVVNGDSLIGPNCRIHPGVTIGASHGKAPIIGHDVFIGPNAVIIGPITIGDGASIGPQAYVNFDVLPGQTCLAPRATVKNIGTKPWNSSVAKIDSLIANTKSSS